MKNTIKILIMLTLLASINVEAKNKKIKIQGPNIMELLLQTYDVENNKNIFKKGTVFSSSTFSMKLIKYANFQLIKYHGNIKVLNSRYAINELLDRLDQNKPLIFIINNSSGGSTIDYINLGYDLKNKAKSFYYIVAGACQSACTLLSAYSDYSIVLEPYGSLGIHRGEYLNFLGGFKWEINPIKTVANTYRKFGANKNWFLENSDKLYEDNSMYYMTEKDALDAEVAEEFLELPIADNLGFINWLRD